MRLRSAACACILLACTGNPPETQPLPEVDVAALGTSLREQLEPVLASANAAPEEPAPTGRAGMLMQAYSQHALAVPFLERASTLAPNEVRWHYYLGISLAELGRQAEAQHAFRACLQLDPEMTVVRARLADSLLDTGSAEESLEQYRAASREVPQNPRFRYGLGRAAAAAGNSEEALQNLLEAVRLAPSYGVAHYALAMAYREQGAEADSSKHLELFEVHEGDEPPIDDPLLQSVRSLRVSASEYLQRGVEAKAAGRTEEAIRLHLRALEEDPALLIARVNLVILYGGTGRVADAEEQYRTCLDKGLESAELHYNYGVLAYGTGKAKEANDAFRRALDLNPNHAQANHNLGQMLEEDGRFDEAMQMYRKALANRPDHALSHYKLGMLWMRKRRATEAVLAFQEAIKDSSDRRPTYLFSLAAAELASGNRDRAAERFQQARREASRYKQEQLISRIDQALQAMDPQRQSP